MAKVRRKKPEIESTPRDAAMARLAAARIYAQSIIESIDDALALFVEPEDDANGRDRRELVANALESAGACSRALEAAEETLDDVDPEECEPWDEDGEDANDDEEEGK